MATPPDPSRPGIDRLVTIMRHLRDPQGGCPWDLEQDFPTIAPHTIEEAYEVAEAIRTGDMAELRDELGDLLFQVVFYAQMADERGAFDFEDVAGGVADKMVRRHPHVFGGQTVDSAAHMTERWEAQKADERAEKAAARGRRPSILDDVIAGLPGLTRAVKLQKRAARVGFDWTEASDILAKLHEELGELDEAIATGEPDRMEDELGDLLFVVANLSRRLSVDPEAALRRANAKFERRFRHIEERLEAAGRSVHGATLDEMEILWTEAKRGERTHEPEGRAAQSTS